MTQSHSSLADQVRTLIQRSFERGNTCTESEHSPDHADWEIVALSLFELQYATVPAYRLICDARGRRPGWVRSWL